MSSPSPIPIFICGKFPTHIAACAERVKPEFEVLAHASSLEAIKTNLTPLLSENRIRAIAMGGGFSDSDFTEVYENVPGAKGVPWIRPEHKRPGFAGEMPKGPPSAEGVSEALRRGLEGRMGELRGGNGEGAGEIWYF